MKRIILSLITVTTLLTIQSCGRDFEEINKDTSRIQSPSVGSLLAPVQYSMGIYGYNRADDFTFDVMQIALDFPNEGNTFSRYYLTESSGNSFWNTSYKWLKQVKDLEKFAILEQNNNYLAVSKVLKAWIYANLTDAFGDIPYSEALALDDNISKPKFDQQKDIYVNLLDELKQANQLFDTTKQLSETDLFYQANTSTAGILKWKKFCNSLSLRLLTRIINRNGEVNVHQRIQEIVNNPSNYPIFSSNNDSAVLPISGVAPFLPPISRPQDFTSYRAAGEFFVDALKSNNDPRLSMFFTQAKDLATNQNIGYKGAPSGYALGTTFNYQPSNLNQDLAKAPLKVFIMTYSEVEFILAELSHRGVISSNTQLHYENGVKSILEEWGTVVPTNYFDNPVLQFNNTLEQIMNQKYISLFFVDHQQWYEQRRTGYPVLPNNGGLQNNAQMPQRFMFPNTAKVMNVENYNSAVQLMGGDNINVQMWWNKP